MSAKASRFPTHVEPFFNPDYWGGKELGRESQPWPEHSVTPPEYRVAIDAVLRYFKRGTQREELKVIESGQQHDSWHYPSGTILLSLLEALSAPNTEKAHDLARFQYSEVPTAPAATLDELKAEEVIVERYGLVYTLKPLLSVVTRKWNQCNTLTIREKEAHVLGNRIQDTDFDTGVSAYTVGDVYSYAGQYGHSLVRVTELRVCMQGVDRR